MTMFYNKIKCRNCTGPFIRKQRTQRNKHKAVLRGRTDAEAQTPMLWTPGWEEMTDLKRSWCWESLKAGGEGDDRGWDDWMASVTQWTWVWVNSRSWWWTVRPGVLQSVGSQRVGHDWVNWTELASPGLDWPGLAYFECSILAWIWLWFPWIVLDWITLD